MIGSELQARREALGLTREQLAEAWCFKVDTVSNWEGKDRRPGIPYRVPDQLAELDAEQDERVAGLQLLGTVVTAKDALLAGRA